MMNSPFKINKPFYNAGHMYGWEGEPVGIGLSLSKLMGSGNIEVTVGKDPSIYSIDKEEARSFVKRHTSIYYAKGIPIGVIPWHMFSKKELGQATLI